MKITIFCIRCKKVFNDCEIEIVKFNKNNHEVKKCPKCNSYLVTQYPFHQNIFQADCHGNFDKIGRICNEHKENIRK